MTREEINQAIENQPVMTVEIRVWGHYEQDCTTPLIHSETIEMPNGNYRDAADITERRLKEVFGKNANYTANGWKGNSNSMWFSR